jgi:hypothetical protein
MVSPTQTRIQSNFKQRIELRITLATPGSSYGSRIAVTFASIWSPKGVKLPLERMSPVMRNLLQFLVVALCLLASAWFHSWPVAASDAVPQQPVLVELFTSEGCSSCPPADALLSRLDATQFVRGAHAIVLSEHVTYWNDLGWHDPFSMEANTNRQHRYEARMGLSSVYTPQAVVDGAADVLGSDAGALSHAITKAAQKPKTQLNIENAVWQGDTLHFAVRAASPAHARLMAVLAEDATQSSVRRGENAGRTLHHVAVVRLFQDLGPNSADGRLLTLSAPADDPASPAEKSLRLVVFLADPQTGKVQGVAETPVAR